MGLKYQDVRVELRRALYDNNRIAIIMVTRGGCRYCTITINAYEHPLESGESHIKNWSENEGMLDWLLENKLATDTGKRVQCGYATAPVVCFNLEGIKDY